MRTRPPVVGAVRLAAALLALTALALPVNVFAQETGEPGAEPEPAPELELIEETLPLNGAGVGLVLWVEGRRAYQWSEDGGRHLVSIDLDARDHPEVARSEPLPGWTGMVQGLSAPTQFGFEIAVDETGGRLFVPYFRERTTCPGNTLGNSCFEGIYVLDAETLDLQAQIPFAQVGDDGVIAAPRYSALTYSPGRGSGDEPKLHLLLEESTHREFDDGNARARANIFWVAQIDIADRRVDWVSRVDGCTGKYGTNDAEQNPTTLFRASDATRPFVYVGCYGPNGTGWVVRLVLDEGNADRPVVSQERFPGPNRVVRIVHDVEAERVLLKTVSNGAGWWVFDGPRSTYIGQVGIGPYAGTETITGWDPYTGTLFEVGRAKSATDGGLFVGETRAAKLSQAVPFPELAELAQPRNYFPMAVDPARDGRPRRLYLRPGANGGANSPSPDHYLIIEDRRPEASGLTPAVPEPVGTRTDDVPETPGITDVRFTSTVRGYGFRTILVGGVDAIHNSTADHTGIKNSNLHLTQNNAAVKALLDQLNSGDPGHPCGQPNTSDACDTLHETVELTPDADPCGPRDRELTFGMVGTHANAAQVTPSLAVAEAQAAVLDAQTERDLSDPTKQCADIDVRSIAEEFVRDGLPRAHGGFEQAACLAPDADGRDTEDTQGDPVFTGFQASVSCAHHDQAVSGSSYARMIGHEGVNVAEAGSSFELARIPGDGTHGRIVSYARGIGIVGEHGAVRIDSIRASASVWARGRSQDGATDDPGCAPETRTAGSCYERAFSGVVVTANGDEIFSCESCSGEESESQFVNAMRQALGTSWTVRLREPDPAFAAGSQDGYQAAVIKREDDGFEDALLRGDLLPTVPALELVRINDSARDGRGRQVFQFAGTEISSQHAILCLLTVLDGECAAEPASLTISLTDGSGTPLGGGVFEATGVGGGGSALEALGQTCVTDATGTCRLTPVAAGTYTVRQTVAPPGFTPSPDATITLPPGGQGRLDFVNAPLLTTGLSVRLVDGATNEPLEGGGFEILADDGNGAASVGDVRIATCVTAASGDCRFTTSAGVSDDLVRVGNDQGVPLLVVPPGPYVVSQTSSPDGYGAADDVAFELDEGQLARVTVSNGRRVAPAEEPAEEPHTEPAAPPAHQDEVTPPAPPVEFEPAPAAPSVPPVVTVDMPAPPATLQPPLVAPPQAGGVVERILQVPVDLVRLGTRNPREAAAFGLLSLIGAAVPAGLRRRQLLLHLLSQ